MLEFCHSYRCGVSVSISCQRRTAMCHSGATTSKHVGSRSLNPTRIGKLTHLELEPRLRAAETHCSRYGTVGAQFYQAVAAAGTWASRDGAQAVDESRATSKTAAASAASSWDTGFFAVDPHVGRHVTWMKLSRTRSRQSSPATQTICGKHSCQATHVA